MDPDKAPSSNGFLATFYQQNWEVAGRDVRKMVQQCFEFGRIIKNINETILVLILKVLNPANLKQFYPISLYNVGYKLITKIIMNRLMIILLNIIAHSQYSFVPKR